MYFFFEILKLLPFRNHPRVSDPVDISSSFLQVSKLDFGILLSLFAIAAFDDSRTLAKLLHLI